MALTKLIWVVLNVPMHLESLKDARHLQACKWLIGELLEKIAEMPQTDAVASLDDLTRKELPLLLGHLLGYLIEQVNCRVFHNLLMQRTICRPVVVQGVLPAAIKVTGLTLAVSDVLAEIDTFSGRDIKPDRLSQVFEGHLAILVTIKPVENIANVLFRCNVAPSFHKLLEAPILYVVVRRCAPFIEDTL